MNQTFTSVSPCYNAITELRKTATYYAVVLVESDQLWHPEEYSTGFYNLMFVPENVPKIAYATSFGVSQIPESKKKIAKQFLSKIDYIGV